MSIFWVKIISKSFKINGKKKILEEGGIYRKKKIDRWKNDSEVLI